MPTKAKKKAPPSASTSFNTKWFKDQMHRAKLTNRQIALIMGVNHTLISHMFSGRRKMPLDEAPLWAKLLGVPLSDVLFNAGIELPEEMRMDSNGHFPGGEAGANVPLKGWVDSQLKINWGSVKGAKSAPNPLPGDLGKGLACVRCQTSGGAFEGIDGALIYFREVETGYFDAESLGRLCVVEIGKDFYIRIVKRGYSTGRHNLALFNGAMGEEDVLIKTCTPVLWMKL